MTKNLTKVQKYLLERKPMIRCCISFENGKMGAIPSVSLPPVKSFVSGRRICVCCKCNGDCYAKRRIYNRRKGAAACYEDNLYTLENEPDVYWKGIEAECMVSKCFRYHVSGEILDSDYFQHMIDIANRQKDCQMLCFTKRYDIINEWIANNGELPQNLKIIFSAWRDFEMVNPYNLPECHLIYEDKTSTADPNKVSYYCPGKGCVDCFLEHKHCFALNKNEQILIVEH